MPVDMDAFGVSLPGRGRPCNQDQFLVAELRPPVRIRQTGVGGGFSPLPAGTTLLLAVADGLGGAPAGDSASRIAVERIPTFLCEGLYRNGRRISQGIEAELRRSFMRCRDALLRHAERHPEDHGLATTLTLACVMWPNAYVVHAGDSRCYLHRRRRLRRLTRDHNLEGVLPQSADPRRRRTLWNVVGSGQATLRPETATLELRNGDSVVLCTDGLSSALDDDKLEGFLGREADVPQLCRSMAEAAVRAGSTDDVTLLIARFLESPRTRSAAAGFRHDSERGEADREGTVDSNLKERVHDRVHVDRPAESSAVEREFPVDRPGPTSPPRRADRDPRERTPAETGPPPDAIRHADC